ncbi:MAG TPA: hypothetical protein VGV09_06630 [Steroidobacteraceae bacterium]|nr:hypothetical protein [Steroidobacteraceae bacterium]
MLSRLALLIGVINLVASAGAAAADDGVNLPEVEVTAKRPHLDWTQRNELVQKTTGYVDGIAAVDYETLARWHAGVCPLVTGLSSDQNEFVRNRIIEIAIAAELPRGGRLCRANLLVFVSTKPSELLRDWKNHSVAKVFGTATRSRIDQFIDLPGAVKVWYNARKISNYGATSILRSGDSSIWGIGPVFVVADQARLAGVSLRQFADYAAMVGLAQIKGTAHTGDTQSILGLFDGDPKSAPDKMTDWDQAFLKMLYTPESTHAAELNNIALRMVRDLVP